MLVIPILAVTSQQVKVVLAGQNCQIAIYQRGKRVFVDLNSNGADISTCVLAHDVDFLNPNLYSGFQGNLCFVDTQGSLDPQYTGFNSRWFLVYLTEAEFLAAAIQNPNPPVPLNLLTTDDLVIIYLSDGDVIIVT